MAQTRPRTLPKEEEWGQGSRQGKATGISHASPTAGRRWAEGPALTAFCLLPGKEGRGKAAERKQAVGEVDIASSVWGAVGGMPMS